MGGMRPQRSSVEGKRTWRPKTSFINDPDQCAVPCTIKESAAASESYMYLNRDTCWVSDSGPLQDGDDAEFRKFCMPMYSPESHNFWEECLSKDEWVGCQSSGTDWVSFAPSRGGATASASCHNSVSLENHMNEEDPADSLPQPLHQDKKGEVSDHAVKCQCSEISNSSKETTVSYDGASRPDTSVDLRNISNSIEMDYNKKTSQSASRPSSFAGGQNISLKSHNLRERYRVKSFTVPEFFVEVPESASVGFLKKAIREKATKMVDPLLRWENTQYENGFIPKVGTSHQNKLDDGCISSMTATTCSKVVPKKPIVKLKVAKNKERLMMDVNSLDVGNVPQKAKSSKNEKRRKIEPFSISEVEALIQKIEEQGTGRWAKIKEEAFGQDSRRTRMDLRDKWERLLKTAKTPPEKRRGPKIPQELLDRVVAIDKCNSQR